MKDILKDVPQLYLKDGKFQKTMTITEIENDVKENGIKNTYYWCDRCKASGTGIIFHIGHSSHCVLTEIEETEFEVIEQKKLAEQFAIPATSRTFKTKTPIKMDTTQLETKIAADTQAVTDAKTALDAAQATLALDSKELALATTVNAIEALTSDQIDTVNTALNEPANVLGVRLVLPTPAAVVDGTQEAAE